VNLIGKVHIPVQFEASPDGKCWAGTVITQDHPSDSSHLWYALYPKQKKESKAFLNFMQRFCYS